MCIRDSIWTLNNDQLADFRLNTIGFVFQDYHLFPRLTTAENVAIPLILKQRNWNESITEARKQLEIVGLKNREMCIRDSIEIVPADPQVIYVPVYQPDQVYYDAPYGCLLYTSRRRACHQESSGAAR